MAELKDTIVKRLDEIANKLDGIGDTFNNLIETLDNMTENLGGVMEGLTTKIGEYSTMITEKGQEDFEAQKNQLLFFKEQLTKVREGIGTEQLMKMSEALRGILEIFGETKFNPEELQNKISDIKKFVDSKRG